jgi:glycosyltransferase involved in cell wall biosynthesis
LDLWPESVTSTSGFSNRFVIGLLDKVVRYIYSKADYILVSSKLFEESIKLRSDNKRIMYFPNWAESLYENPEIKKDLELPVLPNGFNIMFAGNIGEAQDFETILKAANLTKTESINWVLIGDGRKLNWVKSQVKVHDLHNVYIYGRYPIEKMPTFFQSADVMLLTLKKSPISELTVPAKLQAYLASGKIILGAINGEAKSIINNNNVGLASDSGDFNSLSDNAIILKNLTNQQKLQSENNAKNLYFKEFSKNSLLNKLEDMFLTDNLIE